MSDIVKDEDILKESPELDYKDAVHQVDHDEAFQLYFRLRNVSKVAEKCDISKSTIFSWKKKYAWDDRIRSIEEKSRAKVDRSLEEMTKLQQNMYRFLQMRAFAEIREGSYMICPKCNNEVDTCPICESKLPKKLQFRNMNEVIRVLDTAIKGERLVSGLTTSNVGIQVIQMLSDQYSERLGIALGRLVKNSIITEYMFSKIINEFNMAMNEKPITVSQLKSGNTSDIIDVEPEIN